VDGGDVFMAYEYFPAAGTAVSVDGGDVLRAYEYFPAPAVSVDGGDVPVDGGAIPVDGGRDPTAGYVQCLPKFSTGNVFFEVKSNNKASAFQQSSTNINRNTFHRSKSMDDCFSINTMNIQLIKGTKSQLSINKHFYRNSLQRR
jgi:hypothetical protein